MSKIFRRLRIAFFILSPVFVLLFIGMVMVRENLVLKRSRPPKSEWEKFKVELGKIKNRRWRFKQVSSFKFYYRRETDLERTQSSLFSALSLAEEALSRRFNRPAEIFLLDPKEAKKILGEEKSYVSLKKEPLALLSIDFSKKDLDLLAFRLICYSLSDANDSYWFREGLARYFAFKVVNQEEEPFLLSKASAYRTFRELEEVKDIFSLGEREREDFCRQSANIVSYLLEKVGQKKIPFLLDSLSAGSSGRAAISYLTGRSVSEFEKEWQEKFLSPEKPVLGEKENRGLELSRLALRFYLVTFAAIFLGSALTYWFSKHWRD